MGSLHLLLMDKHLTTGLKEDEVGLEQLILNLRGRGKSSEVCNIISATALRTLRNLLPFVGSRRVVVSGIFVRAGLMPLRLVSGDAAGGD